MISALQLLPEFRMAIMACAWVLFIALLCAPARAAVLRAAYVDSNGLDIRFESVINPWWSANVDEYVVAPAGTELKIRNGATLLPGNRTLPVDITMHFRTAEQNPARIGMISWIMLVLLHPTILSMQCTQSF